MMLKKKIWSVKQMVRVKGYIKKVGRKRVRVKGYNRKKAKR